MTLSSTPDYPDLRAAKRILHAAAPIVGAALILLGGTLFFERSWLLMTTAYGLGERVLIGVFAVGYLGGCTLAAVLVRRIMLAASDLVDVLVDQAAFVQRTNSLLENELVPAVEQLTETLRAMPIGASSAPSANTTVLSTDDIIAQLTAAKKLGDPDHVLELRAALLPRLSESNQLRFDRELADWFSKHFQEALRSGKAALVVAAWGRAVADLGDIPEMKHLRESLPTVRRSAGLCTTCGRPYRGSDGRCPTCRQRNGDKS